MINNYKNQELKIEVIKYYRMKNYNYRRKKTVGGLVSIDEG
ncbi:MAG: hypothetical protein ACRDA4_05935 [Filifactoraceae bacterium]